MSSKITIRYSIPLLGSHSWPQIQISLISAKTLALRLVRWHLLVDGVSNPDVMTLGLKLVAD